MTNFSVPPSVLPEDEDGIGDVRKGGIALFRYHIIKPLAATSFAARGIYFAESSAAAMKAM